MKVVPKLSFQCPQTWESMEGDEKKRFCTQCQLHVHNLSALTAKEQDKLLSSDAKSACVAFVGSDNVIQVRSSTWRMIQKVLRPARVVAVLLALVLPSVFAGCGTTSAPPSDSASTSSAPCSKKVQEVSARMHSKGIVGVMPIEEPSWKRFLFFWR